MIDALTLVRPLLRVQVPTPLDLSETKPKTSFSPPSPDRTKGTTSVSQSLKSILIRLESPSRQQGGETTELVDFHDNPQITMWICCLIDDMARPCAPALKQTKWTGGFGHAGFVQSARWGGEGVVVEMQVP